MLELIGGYLFIFCARICDVSLATMRTLMVVRGMRIYAALIGFFEVTIFVIALNKIFTNLSDPLNLLSYALGFATGNFVGSLLEEKLAVGVLTVQVITMKQPQQLTDILRGKGYGVTVIEGSGKEGPRLILQIILPRKKIKDIEKEIDNWDPEAFLTVFDARTTKGGIFDRKGK